MAFLTNFLSTFRRNGSSRDPRLDRLNALTDRQQQYARFLRAYQGYSVRGVANTSVVRDWKRVKYNFIQPVVNLSAGWFAAKPLDWDVDENPLATAEAYRIWDRSGSDRLLLENALCACIYGDMVAVSTQDPYGNSKLEFVDPCICTPTFDGADYSHLKQLEIAFEVPDENGRPLTRREMWGVDRLEVYLGDELLEEESRSYDFLPAVWIRNASVKGIPFGLSDVEPILDLVEEYDHVATKQTRIVDYYSSPNIVFEGMQQSDIDKQTGTVFFLPAGAKAYFLEWSGSGPAIEDQLTRMRNTIAEISQVPQIAFGQVDVGLQQVSGVALQILYGPLISKTARKQASWGPPLEYLMWLCLRASGFEMLKLEQVNIKFPDATPLDGQAKVAESSAKVAAGLSSRRTEMNNMGIENPNSELKRIAFEERFLAAVVPPAATQTNAVSAAKAGAAGRFAQEVVAGVGVGKEIGAPQSLMSPEQMAAMLAAFDAMVQAEDKSIRAAEALRANPPQSG